ncbi:MAG: phage major capsid protein [Oscillospiraceae bacterium]
MSKITKLRIKAQEFKIKFDELKAEMLTKADDDTYDFEKAENELLGLEKECRNTNKELDVLEKMAKERLEKANGIEVKVEKTFSDNVDESNYRNDPAYVEAWAKAIRSKDKGNRNQPILDYFKGIDTGLLPGLTGDDFSVLVPTLLETNLLRKIEETGSILKKAYVTSIEGIVKISIEKRVDLNAKNQPEDSGRGDEAIFELDSVLMSPEFINAYIKWTEEVELMSAVDLMSYIGNRLAAKFIEKIEFDMLYGAKENEALYGIFTELAADPDNGRIVGYNAKGVINFEVANTVLGEILQGKNITFIMNRKTYYKEIINQKDTTGRPLHSIDVVTKQPLFNGYPVEFNSQLKPWDTALATDYPILVVTDDFYRINAPNGMTPEVLIDRFTQFADNKNALYMRNRFAGRLYTFQSSVAIKKGTVV